MDEEGLELRPEALGVGREAEQLGQLADDDDERQPVHVAHLHLVGQEVGHEAEAGESHADLDEGDDHGQHAGQGDGPVGVAPDQQRDQGGEDHRRDGRVGAEHQDPRRPEDGVSDQASDGRVEAGDGWKAGQLGVGHPLGNQDGR